jgi:hypothetical protein
MDRSIGDNPASCFPELEIDASERMPSDFLVRPSILVRLPFLIEYQLLVDFVLLTDFRGRSNRHWMTF